MKIYTKTGDKGTTSLLGGTRVPKYHLRIETYGTTDELNSYIGLVRDQLKDDHQRDVLKEIQDRIFTIGSTLASDPEKARVKIPDLHEADIEMLEKEIDRITEKVPPLRSFILPGGATAVSFCHVARCVCRRAERLAVHLSEEEQVQPVVVKYLNRLSDFLFALAREVAFDLKVEETPWKPRL